MMRQFATTLDLHLTTTPPLSFFGLNPLGEDKVQNLSLGPQESKTPL